MRMIKMLFTVTLGVCCCVYIGYLTEMQCSRVSQSQISDFRSEITSIADFQQLLNSIEPSNPIEADGRLGPSTQKKWDRIICNQYAAETFKEINHELTRRDTNEMKKYIISWECKETNKTGEGTQEFTLKQATSICETENSKYNNLIVHKPKLIK